MSVVLAVSIPLCPSYWISLPPPPLGRPWGYLFVCLVVAVLWVTPYGVIILGCRPLMPNSSLSWMSTVSQVVTNLFLVVIQSFLEVTDSSEVML
ncbi:hypothetical protein DPMN_049981 [Dreissena polymorpha]|uniref:Uncharacterized protein n=1 Tax=Dreissena polymorpha TaxID=45954 RepID=A0A9D4CF99_DREPO|nr:hypothetical protein DPMN_049981 [Dreissena polymorpha]